MGRRHPASGASSLPFAGLPEQRRPVVQGLSRRASNSLKPAGVQPDLLDWRPPLTHLPSQDVDAVLLSEKAFRAPSGETFLYHLTDPETAHTLMTEGLPLASGLFFRPASGVAPDLAETAAEGGGETVLLRVRRRLIRRWLVAAEREGRPGAVLVPQGQTISA